MRIVCLYHEQPESFAFVPAIAERARNAELAKGQKEAMPVLIRLRYCVIAMYFDDHNPPHFHVVAQGREAQVAIASLEVMRGEVDRRAMREAREWAESNRTLLWSKWEELNP